MLVGHPEYYPRFEFERASNNGIKPQREGIPDEAFMILWLGEPVRHALPRTFRSRQEFDQAL